MVNIICIFKESVYYEVEPFLFKKFMAFVSQKKLENGNFELTIGCTNFDADDIVKYISKQPKFISLKKNLRTK